MLKLIFTFVTDQFTLFDNYLYNYISMGIIGIIAFAIAYGIVGRLYDDGMISGSGIGSVLHWTIRLIVCTALFLCVSFVIWVVKLILSIPIYVWLIVAGVIALGFIITIIGKMNSQTN
jgi:hypothetical protein